MSPRLLQVRPFPPLPPVLPCAACALLPGVFLGAPQDAAFTPQPGEALHPGSAPGARRAWAKCWAGRARGEVAASADLLLLSVQAVSPLARPPHAC